MLKEYFSFTQKERIAIFTLLALILGIYLLPHIIKPAPAAVSEEELKAFHKLEQQLKSSDSTHDNDEPGKNYALAYTSSVEEVKTPSRLFYFDPNTISADDWKKLGLRDKTIGTIQKYLNKGGHFYTPSDLKKIYGLKEEEYDRIAAYIRIQGPARTDRNNKQSYQEKWPDKPADEWRHNTGVKKYAERSKVIDINTADTSAFIALPGIGSKLAARIVNFRDKLGGFYAVEQLGETYGLHDSTFQKLRPFLSLQNKQVRQINLNTASLEELKQHPYIRWNLAAAIIRYREQHRPFKSPDDLLQIGAMTVEAYSKMKPYLAL